MQQKDVRERFLFWFLQRALVLPALVSLFAVAFILRFSGFRRMQAFASAWQGLNDRSSSTDLVVSTISTATERAAKWCYPRPLCLKKSYATALLLHVFGIRSKVVIGVQQFPLRGHAWVEIDGQVIGDDIQEIHMYHPLSEHMGSNPTRSTRN